MKFGLRKDSLNLVIGMLMMVTYQKKKKIS